MDPITAIALIWILLPFALLILWLRAQGQAKSLATARDAAAADAKALNERFSPILSIEAEIARLQEWTDSTRQATDDVRSTYAEKRKLLDQPEKQVAVYDERLSFAELGIYEPHFEFSDSTEFKDAIARRRTEQKALVAAKGATICPSNWTVDGSMAKGQTMVNRQSKLTRRAFNSECEAAIANVRWNNFNAMHKRICTAFEQINGANSSMNLRINPEYSKLKLEELRLTHEYREKLKAEKEERAEMARAEREEKNFSQRLRLPKRRNASISGFSTRLGPKLESTRVASRNWRLGSLRPMPLQSVPEPWLK